MNAIRESWRRLVPALLLLAGLTAAGQASAGAPTRCLHIPAGEVLLMHEPCLSRFVTRRAEGGWRYAVTIDSDSELRPACWREEAGAIDLLINGLTESIPAPSPEPLANCRAFQRLIAASEWEVRIGRCDDDEQATETRRSDCAVAMEIAGGFSADDPRRLRTLAAGALVAPTLAEEERLTLDALAFREQHLGDDFQGMVATLASLAVVRKRQGDRDASIGLFRRALALGDRRLGAGNVEVTAWRLIFGKTLKDWGLLADAEAEWRICVDAPRLDADPRRINASYYAGSCADLLARHYEALGRADEARRYRERSQVLKRPLLDLPGGVPLYTPEPDYANDPA